MNGGRQIRKRGSRYLWHLINVRHLGQTHNAKVAATYRKR